jgi:thiamine biosynthesis lipoprotein
MEKKLSRRDFIKITAVAGGLLVGGKLLADLLDDQAVTVRETRLLMGTIINLAVVAESQTAGEAAMAATFAELERQISIFNYRDPASPLSILNRTGRLENPPAELVEVLEQSLAINAQTGGAFDVTIKPLLDLYQGAQPGLPADVAIRQALSLVGHSQLQVSRSLAAFALPDMAVTLDGIAKGYIVDAGTAELVRLGYPNVFVEAGGDLMASGTKAEQTPWKVGVQAPRQSGSILASFNVSNQSAATSGDYLNYFTPDLVNHHIIDPRTGHSPAELASATIVSRQAARSDALATAVMVLGAESGLALVESLPGVECYLVTKDNRTLASAGFQTA